MAIEAEKFPKGIETVSSAVIRDSDGNILLTQSPKWLNKWTLPGGHIEPGETIFEAATREGEEETGLILKPIEITNFGELINSPDFIRTAHFIYFHVLCDLSGELKLDNNELTDHKWLKPEEALKLDLAEGVDVTIQKLVTS